MEDSLPELTSLDRKVIDLYIYDGAIRGRNGESISCLPEQHCNLSRVGRASSAFVSSSLAVDIPWPNLSRWCSHQRHIR